MRIMVNKWINLKHFISSQSVYSINHDGAMEATTHLETQVPLHSNWSYVITSLLYKCQLQKNQTLIKIWLQYTYASKTRSPTNNASICTQESKLQK